MQTGSLFIASLLGLGVTVSGCVAVSHTETTTPPPARVESKSVEVLWVRTELYFGRATPTAEVNDEQWKQFVDEVITPDFPDGLSVDDLSGQWRGPDGKIVRERSKCVVIFHPDTPESTEKIDRIRKAYADKFKQDSVMKVESPARVKF